MNANARTPVKKDTQTVVADPSQPTARKARYDASPYTFILGFVVFCLVMLLYPVVYSLTLSFREATVETFVSGDMPFNGLAQYQAAVADPVFWRAVINTVLFAFFSILFQFTIGFLFGATLPG
jgi:multiple sugar transport system permease protein